MTQWLPERDQVHVIMDINHLSVSQESLELARMPRDNEVDQIIGKIVTTSPSSLVRLREGDWSGNTCKSITMRRARRAVKRVLAGESTHRETVRFGTL